MTAAQEPKPTPPAPSEGPAPATPPASAPPPAPSPAAPPPPSAAAGAPEDAAAAEREALKAQVASLEDRLRRQQADFVNEVQRIRRQADERVRFAAQPVVEDLLGVADALHGAVEGLKDSEHERRVAEGLRHVERQLIDSLGRHGVTRVEAVGKPFDPAFHEAIVEVDSPATERTVLQVLRPGFLLHGRLVRPAHVVVSRPRPPAAPASAPPAEPPPPQDDGARPGEKSQKPKKE